MSMNLSGFSTGEYQSNAAGEAPSGASSRRIPMWIFVALSVFGDFCIVAVAALCAHPISHGGVDISPTNIAAALLLGFTCHFTFQRGRLYECWMLRDGIQAVGQVFARWSFLCLLILAWSAISGTLGTPQSHTLLLFFATGLGGLCLQRLILEACLRYWIARGGYIHSVAVIGDDASTKGVVRKLRYPGSGIHVLGAFSDQLAEPGAFTSGDHSWLKSFGKEEIDTVIIADRTLTPAKLSAALHLLREHPSNIYATLEAVALPRIDCGWATHRFFPDLDLVLLASCPRSRSGLLAKHVMDRLLALLLLLFISPVMLFCCVGVMISDPGPIFFFQKRVGYKGQEFSLLKFRSMYVSPQPNHRLTTLDDPRVFPFGRFIRKTSLDELPQLLNVLMGEMSLVGPRPHMPQATAAGVLYFDAVGEYAARHRVKPGITGWAQVNGCRGPTETIEQIKSRVAHDLYYIENWSLVLDFVVLLKTAFVLFGKNVF